MESHEGFAIREYVSRMRSVNVVQCWPFDDTTSEESVRSLLPPITIKKFIWWLDGLEHLHTESSKNVDKSKKKKKKVKGKGQSSDVDVGEAMGVVKMKSSRAKTKATKKRSILEIFAAAPQVERANSDKEEVERANSDEEEEEEVENRVKKEDGSSFSTAFKLSSHEEINWGLKGKRDEKKKKKTKKNKDIILNKGNKVIQKIKKKQEADDKMELSISNKENCFMLKLQDQAKAIESPKSSFARKNENDFGGCASIHKKRPRLHHVEADKKTMACKAFRLIAQNRHHEEPKLCILKDSDNEFSLQQPTKCILQDAVQMNHCGKHMANKHVTFLQKDDIVRLGREPSLPADFLKLQKYYGSDMYSGIGKVSTIAEAGGTENISRIENEMDARPASEEQLTIPCCTVHTSTFMKHHNKEEPYSKSITSDRVLDGKNQHLLDIGLIEAPHDPNHTCPPHFSCMPCKAYCNSRQIKMVKSSSSSNNGSQTEDLGTRNPRFPNEPSASHLSNLERRLKEMPQASTILNVPHPLQYEILSHFSPNELLETVCLGPDRYQAGNICGKRSTNGFDEDFVGLPLNSQGDLIMMSSRATGHFNQLMKSSTNDALNTSKFSGKSSAHRSWDHRTSSWDQLNQFPVEGYLKEKHGVFVPSTMDITDSQGNGQTNLDVDLIKINDHLFHSENSLCKQDKWVQKSHGNEKILSKMRLMGKEFTVDGRGFHEFGDGHVWKDKQVDELHFSNTSINNLMVHDQIEPSLRKLRETLPVPSETTINHRSESLKIFPLYDCQTGSMHQNGFVTRKINTAEKLYPLGLSPGTSGVCSSKSLFSDPFPCDYESLLFNLKLPTPPAYPDLGSSDTQLKNEQNPPHAPRSAIRFPFMHPDLEQHPQSSWSRSPHDDFSPFSDVSRKGTSMSNFQPYHNLGCSHNSCLISGINHCTNSLVSTKPEAFSLYNSFSCGSSPQSTRGRASSPPTLLTQQASMLCYPGIVPISSVQKRHQNENKIRERIKSRTGTGSLDHAGKAKRQPSPVSNVSYKLVKMPSLELEEGFQRAITNSTTYGNVEDVQNVEIAWESCSATNKSKHLTRDGVDQNEERIYPWIESSSSNVRSGPVKLTAGAKHILKACHQSSTRSIDFNIPLAATTTDVMFSESENSAKIYNTRLNGSHG